MESKITKTVFKIADFISWTKQKKLILSPEFQRRSVWKKGAKSFLIDTIVRGLPIPIIFIRDKRININDFEATREVVDGQQRLRTVVGFISSDLLEDYNPNNDKFEVLKSHNKEIAGKSYQQLPDDIKEKILEYEFNVHILPTRMDDREVIQIFRRMNSTNYSLNKQELRNAQWYGEFKSLVYDISEEQFPRWIKWKTFDHYTIARMVEAEAVSECLIAILKGQISGKSSVEIDKYYRDYDETFASKNKIKSRFENVMNAIDELSSESSTSFILAKQKTYYILFVYIYDLLCGLAPLAEGNEKAKSLTQTQTNHIYALNQKLFDRTAPSEVLKSSDRRTTNIKERKRLFEYLKTGK